MADRALQERIHAYKEPWWQFKVSKYHSALKKSMAYLNLGGYSLC